MKSGYEESPVVSKMSTLWTEFCGTTSLHGWARLLGKKTKYIKHFQAIPEPELTFQSSLKAEQYFIALGLKMFFF
jgi:hypothetical protein